MERVIEMKEYSLINIDLNKRATHGSVAHADDIISEAMLRIFYNVDPKGLHRIDTHDKNAVEKSKQMFCFDFGGGMYDHHSESDRNIKYSNGIILAACGKILAAAVNDKKVSEDSAYYLLNNGLYAVQAQDNGQNWWKFYCPFQIPALMSEPDSGFEELVAMATKILQMLLSYAEKYEQDLSTFNDDLQKMTPDGIIENIKRSLNGLDQQIIFHVFHSIRRGYMGETIKKDFRSFKDLISFDLERIKLNE